MLLNILSYYPWTPLMDVHGAVCWFAQAAATKYQAGRLKQDKLFS